MNTTPAFPILVFVFRFDRFATMTVSEGLASKPGVLLAVAFTVVLVQRCLALGLDRMHILHVVVLSPGETVHSSKFVYAIHAETLQQIILVIFSLDIHTCVNIP